MHGFIIALRSAIPDGRAESKHEREIETQRVDPLPEQRGRDELAFAGLLARVESRRDRPRAGESDAVVPHATALKRRIGSHGFVSECAIPERAQ